MAWNGLAQERHMVTTAGLRAASRNAPLASTTAACTRWCDSVIVPRVTITSRLSGISGFSGWSLRGSTREREEDPGEHECAADEGQHGRHFADTRENGGEQRRAHRFPEHGEVHHVRWKIAERPVHPGVTEHHRADGESNEDGDLARRLGEEWHMSHAGEDEQRNEARRVDEPHIRPEVQRLAQTSTGQIVDGGSDTGEE